MDNILIFATFEKKRMQLLREGFTGQKILVLPRIIVQAMDRDPVCSSLYVTDIGYFPHAERHYVSRSHPIDQYVFIYCIEGRGWYSTGGRKYMRSRLGESMVQFSTNTFLHPLLISLPRTTPPWPSAISLFLTMMFSLGVASIIPSWLRPLLIAIQSSPVWK